MQHLANWTGLPASSSSYGRGRGDSTPHAPRLLQRPLRLNTTTHGTHVKHISKSVSDTSTVSSKRTMPTIPNIKSNRVITPANVKMSWNSQTVGESVQQKEKVLVQPYRRNIYRKAPKLVPQLDLSKLNQPDHLLNPVEMVNDSSTVSVSDNMSSGVSWGVYRVPKKGKEDNLLLIDCEEDENELHSWLSSPSNSSSLLSSLHHNFLKRSHLEFIEGKLASHERSRLLQAVDTTATAPVVPVIGISGRRVPPAPSPFAPSYSLDNKLQFEARIATHNGRDVHRQLCGYFFLDDNSITVYEFRKFGKKFSALPLIHRGIYCACSGRKKDHPYQVSDIKKGATLQFVSCDHPNLPCSLLNRTILYLRVTGVSEETKKELVCAGCMRSEEKHKRLQACLASPLSSSALRDAHLLATMQGMLCHLLNGRASLVLVGLGRHLHRIATEGVVNFNQLEQALRSYHISLTTEDMGTFWRLLRGSELWNKTAQGLHLDLVLHALTGVFTEDNTSLVRQIFIRLDTYKSGLASFDQMKKLFRKTESKVWQDMQFILQQKSSDCVSYADFEHFYIGLRIELSSNSKFIKELKCCWGL